MDFVYIDDIARANILAAEADVTDEVFNVASGAETSLLELAQTLLARRWAPTSTSSSAPSAPSTRSPAAWPTPTAARDRLGFEAEVDLEEGLRRLVEWWRAEREPLRRRALAGGVADAGPVRTPVPRRRRGRGRGRGRSPPAGSPRARASRRSSSAFAERVGAARRRRHHQLHDRAAPGAATSPASAPATR